MATKNQKLKHRLFFVPLFLFLALTSKSQERHFVFIQTEDNPLFYVKANNQIFSSTSLGSVIVPKIEEGDLIISIGFPQNRWNPLRYKLIVNNKDLAYILKKSNSNSWFLYDYYSMSIIEALDSSNASNNSVKPVNDFANVLSQVSGVNLEPVFQAEPKSEKAAKDLMASKSVEVSLPKVEAENISDKPSISKVDTLIVKQVDTKTRDTSNPIVNSSEKDLLTPSSKKKDNFIAVDSTIIKVDSISFSKNKPDTLVQVSGSLTVKVDTVEKKINPLIDTLIKEVVKDNRTDSAANTIINIKIIDTTTTIDTSNLVPIVINNFQKDTLVRKVSPSQKDLVFIETVAIQQTSSAIDSLHVNKEFKIEDTIIKTDKEVSIKVSLPKNIDSLIIKDSFILKSNITEIDLPSDTAKANLILDSLMNENKSIQVESLIVSKDSSNTKEVNIAFDTIIVEHRCIELADDNDFIHLRRMMTKEDEESQMISAALMMFKEKCFSVSQIKNLAVLFLNDEAKYKFLETAFPFVSDMAYFKSLESLLSEEKNVKRFKELIIQTKVKE